MINEALPQSFVTVANLLLEFRYEKLFLPLYRLHNMLLLVQLILEPPSLSSLLEFHICNLLLPLILDQFLLPLHLNFNIFHCVLDLIAWVGIRFLLNLLINGGFKFGLHFADKIISYLGAFPQEFFDVIILDQWDLVLTLIGDLAELVHFCGA